MSSYAHTFTKSMSLLNVCMHYVQEQTQDTARTGIKLDEQFMIPRAGCATLKLYVKPHAQCGQI